MIKRVFNYIVNYVKEEYKFLLFLLFFYIILLFPLNYYIVIGGGISNLDSRIEVKDKYKSKGSFNISYVAELHGTIATYLLSYVIPTWDRESTNDYKYNEDEKLEDIAFRGELDLNTANSRALYFAYTLANKNINLVNSKIYVIATFKEYATTLKVQDEILSIEGNVYSKIEEYKEYLQGKNENDTVLIKVNRKGEEKELEVPTYEVEGYKMLGVGLQYLRDYETAPSVEIKFKKSESGPSGGLMTTLEVYNQLIEEDITKGLKIAGTGTIEEDGSVGEIGGIEHKLLGAEKDKADLFLVPSGNNYKDAVEYKKKKKLKIKLLEVKSIEDTLEKLSMM